MDSQHHPLPHPLIEGMRQASAVNPYFELAIHDAGEADWISAKSLFLEDDQRLARLVRAYGKAHWSSDHPHVAGSAFMVAYVTRLVWPVVGQWVRDGRVPDVSLGNVLFHRQGEGIDATALRQPGFATVRGTVGAMHEDSLLLHDRTELYQQLKLWLFDANLSRVIPALHRAAGASVKVSWNATATAGAQALHHLYRAAVSPEAVMAGAQRLYGDAESPIYGELTCEVLEHQGMRGFFARRRGCCLAWKMRQDQGYCPNCILTPREQQDRELREMLLVGK